MNTTYHNNNPPLLQVILKADVPAQKRFRSTFTTDDDDVSPREGEAEAAALLPPTGSTSTNRSLLHPQSSRNLTANINLFMGEYLGEQLASPGKQAVMDLLTTSVPPKFSK